MHLSVTCPRCLSKYQLDPGMRGKRMRCPNTICRAIFEVRDDADPVTESPPPEVKEAPPPKPAEEPKIKEAPPHAAVPSAPKVKEAPPKRTEPKKPRAAPSPNDDFPDDFPGDDDVPAAPAPSIASEAWQPDAVESTPREFPVPVRESVEPAPRRRGRPVLAVVVALLLLLGIAGGVGYRHVLTNIQLNETQRYQQAETLYKDQSFAEASAALQRLERDFPDSPRLKKYRFLAELSDVRQTVIARESPEETSKALERLMQFASVYQGDPLLKERASDVWETLDFLARQLTSLAETGKAPAFVLLSKRAWAAAKKYPAPPSANPAERERKLEDDWKRVEAGLADHFERQHVLAVIQKNTERATASAVAEAWTLVEKTKRQDDAEIRGLLNTLFKAQREQVIFVPADDKARIPVPGADALESLSVTPSLKAERAANVSGAPILALARGVLYALEPAKGELRWARRVGIDTQILPLRVPADALTPELVLVVSSDQRSLSGVIAATGETLWQTPLSDACLGMPVLVDRHVVAPTLAGRIDEIEIAEGRRLGSYHVGQPLTLGGVHQPGSALVYFPADEFCLYVIDIRERLCKNILYTRHAAGALPGLPTVVAEETGGLLLWSQALGLDKAIVKPYALPIKEHDQRPVEPILRLGSISAAPWHDAGRLAFMTQTGLLSLWGVRQKGTRDPLLFPLLQNDFPIDLKNRPGRCQVVHADRENIWILARGGLQRVEMGFHPLKGPDLLTRWTQPVRLGNLLHAVETGRESDGRTILYLTTQADDRPTCLCSAVDGESGKILWQRQLGVLPQDTPRRLGGEVVLASPEGLLRFQPTLAKTDSPWRQAGAWIAQEPWTGAQRFLLTSGTSFVQLSWTKGGTKLRVELGQAPGEEKIRILNAILPAALQGTPALADGFLLLPLANGIVVRLSLADAGIVNGPHWRAIGAEEDTAGHVVVLGAAEFLLSDGSRGLQRVHWADGKTWDKRAAEQLSHRILALPVFLPGTQTVKPRLCALDASDALTLLDADRLTVLRRWAMPGKVSAGPFVRAGKIGVVVGKNRLVWLDPERDEPMWEYAFVADVVGEPHLMEGVLVVADVAGQFLALDPASGRPIGAGLTMKANVAPTAAPIPFGPGRAFVPLTDGTIVVLPLDKLRAP